MENKQDRTILSSWRALFQRGYRSRHFFARYDASSFVKDRALSERLLFTQSNARVLLGQDSTGRLAFVCAPHPGDYAVPTSVRNSNLPITACPGMYYQTDVALWMGKARYILETDEGKRLPTAFEDSESYYLQDFLPVTETIIHDIEMHILSIAPVLEKNSWRPKSMGGAPLPGPSGALYVLHIRNNGHEHFKGKCYLEFDKDFVIRSELGTDGKFEDDCVSPYFCQWERDMYTMWRPDASVMIHVEGGRHTKDADSIDWYVPLELQTGEERTITLRVAVCPSKSGISGAMSMLFQHDALEWIRITDDFWKERIGQATFEIADDAALAEKYRDIQVRNILDNFNCLQMDEDGRLLVHWQGAPSHNVGRFWGIDIEPTVLGILYAIPEIGPAALEYISTRNEPRYSQYTDHSTPIRVALLTIAGKYLELTGDVEIFSNQPNLLSLMELTYRRLLDSKHKTYDLFSSRYSSDGIVFHRYDVGTNTKVWYALKGYRTVLDALGDSNHPEIAGLMDGLQRDMLSYLTARGPFGIQFTGGENFNEGDDFYFRDDLFYYDGEDSSSCLMPVYGLIDYDCTAWRNYHRFARSLFCSNFDPESGALRWFFYGGAVDGTAYVSRIGGSITKSEMKDAVRDMIDFGVDLTGSLFWWPKARNLRRCISRCSQGQGSFVIQGMEQWLGIHFDAIRRVLKIEPRGPLSGYKVSGMRIGAGFFDIDWRENSVRTTLTVRNGCEFPVQLQVGIRPWRCGADGKHRVEQRIIEIGETISLDWLSDNALPEQDFDVESQQTKILADDDFCFDTFSLKFPSVEQQVNAFLFRFAFFGVRDAHDIHVEISVPDDFGVKRKELRTWEDLDEITERIDGCTLEYLKAGNLAVFPFYLRLPEDFDSNNVWTGRHMFAYPSMKNGDPRICIPCLNRREDVVSCKVEWRDDAGNHCVLQERKIVGMAPNEMINMWKNVTGGPIGG